MKKLFLLFVILFSYNVFSQTLVTFSFDGQTRKYYKYVPNIYDSQKPIPVVFCLHGLGDNIDNFRNIAMHLLGEVDTFITIYPEALSSPYGNAWNAGINFMGSIINENINDVNFLMAITDSLQTIYNIDTERIYFCGLSLGGFMAQRMACEKSDKIAAVASVAGTIGNSLNCTPSRPIPICHFHGTNDQVVYYTNNLYGLDAEELVSFWINNNHCDSNYIYKTYPDVVNDGILVESYYFNSPNNLSDVMFYKAIGADHIWLYSPVNDISYTIEIWNFLKKFRLSNSQNINDLSENNIQIFPNPTNSILTITFPHQYMNDFNLIEIYNTLGELVYSQKIHSLQNQITINLSDLSEGIYFLEILQQNKLFQNKIIIKN
ncbi:MAG TPA: T9SS type A sorting domain-containing protein [Bacteroidales bacterium]|nr:T9SS type A sorting domain-containing protein [Bacteroidales bacterium]HPZ36222.1 T9SS type A sorting domain-containing protein [Bacteroidales bacterium]HQD34637.1 T9SS type A sorting domain-containing protein [Bacteroidales bacterium]